MLFKHRLDMRILIAQDFCSSETVDRSRWDRDATRHVREEASMTLPFISAWSRPSRMRAHGTLDGPTASVRVFI